MSDSLREKAASGAIWKTIERLFSQIVRFGVGITLARLLAPEDFGIIGMLTIFIAIANVLQDSGFGNALIQKKNRTETDFSTAFLFNIISSIFVYAILFILAPLIAEFYQTPILEKITRILGITILINGFIGVQIARLNIEFRFKDISVISILGQLATGIVGVFLAYNGFGVWALVYQTLASSVVSMIAVWILSGWCPSITFSVESFKKLFSFGCNMLGIGLINVIYNNLYTLVIGKVFSPFYVGMYNRANSYARLPTDFVNDMAIRVNFPILASIQDDDKRLLRAYRKLLQVPFFILYPILVTVFVMADPLIIFMIGEKWLPCVPILRLLCIASMFIPLNGLNVNLLYVKGRPDLALRLEYIKKPLGLIFLFALIPAGIYWLIAGRTIYSIIVYVVNCYYTKKILNYGLLEQIRILCPIILISVITGVFCHISILFFDTAVLKIIIGTIVSASTYIIISVLRKEESFYEILEIIKQKISTIKREKND